MFLLGLIALDLPYAGLLLLLGPAVWWLATGINYSLRQERIALEPPEDEY